MDKYEKSKIAKKRGILDEKRISIAVIKRLPRYYRYLGDLLDNGIKRISSKELSEKMGITASQIRQDLNNFGCFGQQGYGYNVESLLEEIRNILGLNEQYNMIIIGAGNLGQALINYQNFAKRGFYFTAIFDASDEKIGMQVDRFKVLSTDELETYLRENVVDIAVLAIPREGAENIAKILFAHNIRGIWNFSHTDLNSPENVAVENVHLTDSLMTLSYQLGREIYTNLNE